MGGEKVGAWLEAFGWRKMNENELDERNGVI